MRKCPCIASGKTGDPPPLTSVIYPPPPSLTLPCIEWCGKTDDPPSLAIVYMNPLTIYITLSYFLSSLLIMKIRTNHSSNRNSAVEKMNHVLGEKKLLTREKEELEEQVQVLSDSLNDSMAKFHDSMNEGYQDNDGGSHPLVDDPLYDGPTSSSGGYTSQANGSGNGSGSGAPFQSVHTTRTTDVTTASVLPSTPQPQSQSQSQSQSSHTRASDQSPHVTTPTATTNTSSSSSQSPNSSSSPEFSWLKQSLPSNTNTPLPITPVVPVDASEDRQLSGSTNSHSQNNRTAAGSATSVSWENHPGGGMNGSMNGNTGTPKKRVTFTRNDIFSQMDDFDDVDMTNTNHNQINHNNNNNDDGDNDQQSLQQHGMAILTNASNNNSSPFHALMQSVSVDLHWARPAGRSPPWP